MNKIAAYILFLMFLAFSMPVALALDAPVVTFIPSINSEARFSANASFIAIADLDTEESVRIGWDLTECDHTQPLTACSGLFPKVGNRWICYFSNTDINSTCGPSPFREASTGYNFLVTAINSQGDTATETVNVDVGRVELEIGVSVLEGNNVSIDVSTPGNPINLITGVDYEIYANNFSLYKEKTSLARDIGRRLFIGNVVLDGGEYYIAFTATKQGGDFGGNIVKVFVPGVEVLGPGPATQYPIEAVPADFDVRIGSNQRYTRTMLPGITNKGSDVLEDLDVQIPEEFSDKLNVTLSSDTLAVNQTKSYTVILTNIAERMDIITAVNITSGSVVVGQIPIDIGVTISGGGDVCPATEGISITPAIWTADVSVGEVEKIFTITNNGNSVLSNLDHSTSLQGIEVTLPASVGVDESETMTVTVDKSSSGRYTGNVIIETSAGSASIWIDLNFYGDINQEIVSAQGELETFVSGLNQGDLEQLGSIIDDINQTFEDAKSEFDSSYYSSAQEKFNEAYAKFSLLKDISGSGYTPPTGDGGEGFKIDTGLILIIVIVIVAVVGVWFFLKKIRKGKNLEEELGEEYQEEV